MSERTNRLAVSATETAALELGWFFRPQEVSDQGIDAHFEKFVLKRGADGRPYEAGTGRLIAVQIKGGPSYFAEPSEDGWWFRFSANKMQLWLGHALPVIVVLVDLDESKLYWQRIAPKTLRKAGKGFKVNVPRSQSVVDADETWVDLASGLEQEAQSRFQTSLLELPLSVSSKLQRTHEHEKGDAALLALHLARGRANPRGTVQSLLATRPVWLESNASWGWEAVGNYANEHGLHDLAAAALHRAAESAHDANRIELLVAAALQLSVSDSSGAKALLARAQAEAPEGKGTLLLAVAQTVMSQPAGDSTPWVIDPLLLTDAAEVRSSPPVQRTLAFQAQQRGDFDEAILRARSALELEPTSTETSSLLARLHLARWSSDGAAADDLGRAIDLLQRVVTERRRWAGPARDELERLVGALYAAGRYEAVITTALPPPSGTADERDLDARCLRWAVSAAQLLNRQEALIDALSLLGDSPLDQLTRVRAGVLDLSQDEVDGLRLQVFEDAIREEDYEEIARHGMTLVTDGIDVRDRLQPYVDRSIFPRRLLKLAEMLLSVRTSSLDTVLPELRELSRQDAIAAEQFLALLESAGRHLEAADEAHALYEITRSQTYLIRQANSLIAAHAHDAAVAAAKEAVAGATSRPSEVAHLLTFLADDAANLGELATAEAYLLRVLGLFTEPSSSQVWNLVSVQVAQGRLKRAAKAIAEYKPRVNTPEEARLWLRAHSTTRWNHRIAQEAYDMAERFDNPQLSISLLNSIVIGTRSSETIGPESPCEQTSVEDELSPLDESEAEMERRRQRALDAVPSDLHRKAFELMEQLNERHGEATGIKILRGSDSQDLLDQLVEQVKGATAFDAALEDIVRKARRGEAPVGFVAGVLRRSPSTLVLQRSLGMLMASSPDNDEHDLEVAAARTAIGGTVAVETTTVVTLTGLTARSSLTGRFVSLVVPPATMHDLHRASFDIRGTAGSPGSIRWDAGLGKLALTELNEQEFSRLHERVERLEQHADRLAVVPLSGPGILPQLSEDPAHSPWVSVLELASQRGVPLWSDDLALRRLARTLEASAFGTPALVDAIREKELETSRTAEQDQAAIDRAAQINLELARDFVVDLPITSAEVLQLAEEDHWTPKSAAVIVSRPAWWISGATGIETLQHIYMHAQREAPEGLTLWQQAAMNGLARALQPEVAPRILAEMVLLGFGPGTPIELLAEGLRQAQAVASDLGLPDPASEFPAAAARRQAAGDDQVTEVLVHRVLALAEAGPGDTKS